MKQDVNIYRIRAVESVILRIRGQKVILDADLASIYGVPTKRLNEQVKRNKGRFPADFAFELTPDEKAEVVANCDHLVKLKFSPVLPSAFTEHGAIMAATILNSPKAIQMSVFVVRAFVKMREFLASQAKLGKKLRELEQRNDKHHESIQVLFEAIQQLASEHPPAIGFQYIGSGDSGSETEKKVKEHRTVYIVGKKNNRRRTKSKKLKR